MHMISEHFYEGRTPWKGDVPFNLLPHVALLKNSIRDKAEGHRKVQAELPGLEGRIVPIAMDEWNYWHGDYVYGELGCVYDLADGLGVAAGLHEYFRQSDIIHMAHYAQTVNVIGAIKTTKTAAEMETTGLVLQLYRAHFGSIPIDLDNAEAFAPVDITAALTDDSKALTLGVVNPTENAVTIIPILTGVAPSGLSTRWHIGGPDPRAHNTPGQSRVIDIVETSDLDPHQPLEVPALSCALFTVPLSP